MPTKQQLQDIIEDLETDLRRANRALNQLAVDLPDKPRLPNEEKSYRMNVYKLYSIELKMSSNAMLLSRNMMETTNGSMHTLKGPKGLDGLGKMTM